MTLKKSPWIMKRVGREGVPIYTPESWKGMRRAGALAARTLDYIAPFVLPGVPTQELNDLCHAFIVRHDAIPAPLGYKGYPRSVCISPNHVICHGIPGPECLCDGDIVNIDVTVILDGWYGDTSRTFLVGTVDERARKLTQTAEEALKRGIEHVREGAFLGDIGHAIQSFVEAQGFSVVHEYCGHGIGRVFHDVPQVLHTGRPQTGLRLIEGMFLTIEPMINLGAPHTRLLDDDWTVVTHDGSLSAQFEHTLGVTKQGFEIFTI